MEPLVNYVSRSSVRSDVVQVLTTEPQSTNALLTTLDASESAVYDALTALDHGDIITGENDQWRLTGTGHIVEELLKHQAETEALIDRSPEYWNTRDTSALPRRFRRRLTQLGDYEVVQNTETDFNRVVRTIVNHVETADICDIVSPVYHPAYAEAMPDNSESRLLLRREVVKEVLEQDGEELLVDGFSQTQVGVTTVPYAVGASDEWATLSLPMLDGSWAGAILVSEDDSAIQWCRDLCEFLWEDATPIEEFLNS